VRPPVIVVADVPVADPLERLKIYAARVRTLTEYDLAGQGDPSRLARAEVVRTRVIASRISNHELMWFLERSRTARWSDVEPDADLRDADPGREAGLYDRAEALYGHFRTAAPHGVSGAKISKVLHLKRPSLFPILDSHLVRTYRVSARQAARHHLDRGYRYMYWAAIRSDLTRNGAAIAELKTACASDDHEDVRRMSQLTDLRVLDILTW